MHSFNACRGGIDRAQLPPHHYFLRHRFLTRPCSGQRGRYFANKSAAPRLGSATDIRTFRRFRRSMRITHAITTVLLAYPVAWKVIIFIRVPLPTTHSIGLNELFA